MDYMHNSLCLLLHLLHFTDHGTNVAGKDVSTFTMANEQQPYGPASHTIHGPDAVTVGVPCSFVCLAQCSPECSYTVSIDDHSIEHKELAFTLKQWESSKTVTCTAKNAATGSSSTVRKTLYILEGPVNVSISGPHTLTPGETQRFLCIAHCRPFCTYTWVVDGDSIAGSGDEVVIRPPSEATSGTLICKATNSVSGLFATAILKLRVPSQSTDMAEKEILTTYQTTADQPYGPVSLTIYGPDAVTVGVPCSFVCLAQCSPECNYTIGADGQSGEGNELAFTLKQWESSKTVTCTAKNSVTGRSSSISKTLQILEGPANVSISGPHNLTSNETERFLCTATCRPSCNYTWIIDGEPVDGSGDEVVIRPSTEATSAILICKATNSMSGLFATAVRMLGASSGLNGPVSLTIYGPDAVTVGVPCSFVCSAQCSPECNYTIGIDGQSGEGNELAFTLKQWESSKRVTCTAKNPASGRSSSITKTFQILEGPANVSISGPHNLTSDETERFLCTATCRPSCNYSWILDGVPDAGSGDELVIRISTEATSATLICKATNSVSGLFATAVRKLAVSRSHSRSLAEGAELLPKLLFAFMSVLLVVIPP
ncbi:carcinoembryonic antigen-related cell adhesion molecule 5-like isoform X2 [Colossoma macropomum]|uniref:carcinoembryonic antigen-related cell adhesion molecule 5-like isoform X2 n=1 Tax=Colossoma macropomum TaxID=42526 RepID=UPI0018650CC9|nr:carcinoembryonic antigen-related cell adhesion molecule 5-like isoform X2 [Colossoma macropomum]